MPVEKDRSRGLQDEVVRDLAIVHGHNPLDDGLFLPIANSDPGAFRYTFEYFPEDSLNRPPVDLSTVLHDDRMNSAVTAGLMFQEKEEQAKSTASSNTAVEVVAAAEVSSLEAIPSR